MTWLVNAKEIFERRKKWPYNRKASHHFQLWWRVAFFKTGNCKDTPVSRSPWNDEKTKETYIFFGLKKSDKFTRVKVVLLRHFPYSSMIRCVYKGFKYFWIRSRKCKFSDISFCISSFLWQIFILVQLSPLPGSTYPAHGVSWTAKVMFFVFNLC